MCSHYQAIGRAEVLQQHFGVEPPIPPAPMARPDMWPGYEGVFIRRPAWADAGDEAVPEREAVQGRWGLIPHWARDGKLRNTFNARSETVDTKPSFKDAWRQSQRCIVPAEAVYEPDWRGGRAVPARLSLQDEAPMGLAGLWSVWKSAQGWVHSYTLLTVHADGHDLLRHLHRPEEEKRMVAILAPDAYAAWLSGTPAQAAQLIQAYPAQNLQMCSPKVQTLWS